MIKWLAGRKEIVVSVLGALLMLLPSLGVAPEAVSALAGLQKAIETGNWAACLGSLTVALAFLANAAKAAFERRKAAAMAGEKV